MKKYLCLAVFLSLWALPAAALPDNDSNNTLTYDGQTVAGLEPIVAGHGQQNADGNTVTVSNSTIQDNNSPVHNAQVVGGWAVSGTANQNRVEITDSTVNRNIVGGQSTFGTQANGNIINITVDVIKHCVLFLACTPNAKKRNMLKNTRLIRKSLSIFNIIARANKMTNFTIVK